MEIMCLMPAALRVDNNHGAATKDPETNRPQLTIVSSAIGDFNRGACEDALRIEEVQASLLEGAERLAGSKRIIMPRGRCRAAHGASKPRSS
jgi:hypothetical protein